MISMTTLSSSSDAAKYHDSALKKDGGEISKDADNYYVNESLVATWQGRTSKLLGIEGSEVKREDFINYLEGKFFNPKNGVEQDLSKNSKGANRRLGYDFTVSAPKSVSIVGLVGRDERVIDAHKIANATALAWLEKNGAQIRVKDENGNNKTVTTGNLLYATVQHETSRANDPQLHNHNVIISATYDKAAQKWRSITNDELLNIRMMADSVYKNELAQELKKVGYEITYAVNGRDFEIKGISEKQLKDFSERSAQIDAALKKRGIDPENASHAARQTAALDSRAKKSDIAKNVLQETWEVKAEASGIDLAGIIANSKNSIDQHRSSTNDLAREAHRAVFMAINHLSERQQSFKSVDLEVAALHFGNGQVSLGQMSAAVQYRLKEKSLVKRDGEGLLTTSQAISNELTLQNSIAQGKGRGVQVMTNQGEFDKALVKFEARKSSEKGKPFKLSNEQVAAAKNVLMHPDQFQGIQGDAGTGKTAALEFVKEAASDKGWELKGMATSSTGARELQEATGIKSSTVAAFLVEHDKKIKTLTSDIRKLTIEISNSPIHTQRIKQVERRDMNLKGKEGGFGSARYVFDNKTGNVYKSASGPLNLLNHFGQSLTDEGNRRQWDAEKEWSKAEKFTERFKVRLNLAAGIVQARIGRQLATYEKVGEAEAIGARQFHETEKHHDHNQLVRALETKTAQLNNVQRAGNIEGKKVMLVMDESSLTGTNHTVKVFEIAKTFAGRVVTQGDIKQHGSVAAGKAFLQTQESGINLSKIEETRRFDKATPQTKQAIEQMKLRNYAGAMARLENTIVMGLNDLYIKTAERYVDNRAELMRSGNVDPKVGIVALTNMDRKAINNAVRHQLQERGDISKSDFVKTHLDDPKLTPAQLKHVQSIEAKGVDRVTAQVDYKSFGIKKDETLNIVGFNRAENTILLENASGRRITIDPKKEVNFSYRINEERLYSFGDKVEARSNIGRKREVGYASTGTRGVIAEIDSGGAKVVWQDGKSAYLSNDKLQAIDHAYAHTTYKEQGVTNDRQILAVSDTGASVMNREAAYVAASRARDNTEIVTNSMEKLLRNVGKEPEKTTAIDIARGKQINLQQENQVEAPKKVIKPKIVQEKDKGKKQEFLLGR